MRSFDFVNNKRIKVHLPIGEFALAKNFTIVLTYCEIIVTMLKISLIGKRSFRMIYITNVMDSCAVDVRKTVTEVVV